MEKVANTRTRRFRRLSPRLGGGLAIALAAAPAAAQTPLDFARAAFRAGLTRRQTAGVIAQANFRSGVLVLVLPGRCSALRSRHPYGPDDRSGNDSSRT